MALDSDDRQFGGQGRVGHSVAHFSTPEGVPGMLAAPWPHKVLADRHLLMVCDSLWLNASLCASSPGHALWMAGQRETNFNDRPHSIQVLSPPRTAVVYSKMHEG